MPAEAGDRFLCRVCFESQHKRTLLSGAAFRARPNWPDRQGRSPEKAVSFSKIAAGWPPPRAAPQWMSGADWRATGRESSKSPGASQHCDCIFIETSLCEARFDEIESRLPRPADVGHPRRSVARGVRARPFAEMPRRVLESRPVRFSGRGPSDRKTVRPFDHPTIRPSDHSTIRP